jgi:hypothetical protein
MKLQIEEGCDVRSRYRANRLGFREPENGESKRPKIR